jgi:hypothetical protein
VEYAELLVNLKELEGAAIELSILPPKWRGMRGECALLSRSWRVTGERQTEADKNYILSGFYIIS